MDAPKACSCWLHLVSSCSSCTQSLHKFRPQSEVIQKQIPVSRQFQRLHGIPQDMKYDLSILCRHRKDAQHGFLHFTHCSFLSGATALHSPCCEFPACPWPPHSFLTLVLIVQHTKTLVPAPQQSLIRSFLPGRIVHHFCLVDRPVGPEWLVRPKWQEHLP